MAAKRKSKRNAKKSKRKQSKKRLGPPIVGVISTIRITPEMRKAFEQGLNTSDVTYRPAFGYGHDTLRNQINSLNQVPTIRLIVTVGGLVTYEAANAYAASNPNSKPFMSLVGGDITNPNPKFFGGVNLQSYKSNLARSNYLNTKGYPPGNTCLFYNPNSVMQAVETDDWRNNVHGATPRPGGINAQGDNDATMYPNDFARIPAAVTAVVISGDPFFQDTRSLLVAAANASNKYICYPFQTYGDAGPAHSRATLYGPVLKHAYSQLGSLAAMVLADPRPLNPLLSPAQIGQPDDV